MSKRRIKHLDEQLERVKQIDHKGARDSLTKTFEDMRVAEVNKIGRGKKRKQSKR